MIRKNFNKLTVAGHNRNLSATIDYVHQPERDIDNLRTDATEILGEKPGLLMGRYRRKTNDILEKIDKAEDKKDVPGTREKYLAYRSNRTQVKIDRTKEKISSSSDSFLSRQINRQRRQKVEALTTKGKILSRAGNKLEAARTGKPERLQKKIDEYVKKKVDAMYRKARRQEMQKHDIGKVNFVKRAEFLAKLTPEKKKEIVREAILLARKKNIESGRLDATYGVDDTLSTRKVGDYERTT